MPSALDLQTSCRYCLFEHSTPATCPIKVIAYIADLLGRMEDKGKGFSLRQKKSSRRPPISAPKQVSSHASSHQISRPNGSSGPTPRPDAERPKLGGNASDLVKRRYSTRFTQVPDLNSTDVPPIPKLPENQRFQQRAHAAPAANQRIAVDLLALRDPDLQAEHCKMLYLLLSPPDYGLYNMKFPAFYNTQLWGRSLPNSCV